MYNIHSYEDYASNLKKVKNPAKKCTKLIGCYESGYMLRPPLIWNSKTGFFQTHILYEPSTKLKTELKSA